MNFRDVSSVAATWIGLAAAKRYAARGMNVVIADLAHLLWAVNMGCLGFHPWPYLAATPPNDLSKHRRVGGRSNRRLDHLAIGPPILKVSIARRPSFI